MSDRLVALYLFLRELGVDPVIETIDDRKRIQKAVYLGQLSGVKLGFRFGWYLMGPYSSALARDYYKLDERPDSEKLEFDRYRLPDSMIEALAGVRCLIDSPPEGMDKDDWLELLASYHFLAKVRHLPHKEIEGKIAKEKPQLSAYVGKAKSALEEHSFVDE
jgi:hypothetical protein